MLKILPLLGLLFAPSAFAECYTKFNEQSRDAIHVFAPPAECRFASQVFKSKLPSEQFSTQEVLWIAHSMEGEVFNDFIHRIAGMLVQYSKQTGYEGCGVFAGNLNEYGIIITTNRSALACVTNHDLVPNQMITLKRTIHSHGAPQTVYTAHDATLLKRAYKINTRLSTDLYQFSEQDLKFSGYLATPNGVIYHDKRTKKITVVGKNPQT